MECKTVRIKSTDPTTQGEFVLINESDYDPEKHGPVMIPPPPVAVAPLSPPPPAAAPDPLASLAPNWRDSDVSKEMKAFAQAITGRAVENREQAVTVIDDALKARATA
jgi:hypothetical protein